MFDPTNRREETKQGLVDINNREYVNVRRTRGDYYDDRFDNRYDRGGYYDDYDRGDTVVRVSFVDLTFF